MRRGLFDSPLRTGSFDPAAAEDYVALIKNHRLPRRDRLLRLKEADLGTVLRQRLDPAGDRLVAVPDLAGRLEGCSRGNGDPVDVPGGESPRVQLVPLPDDH